MSHLPKESQIKQKIVNILKEFRNLVSISPYNVTINELERSLDKYIIKGKYRYDRVFAREAVEEGTFEITLSTFDLEPIKTLINPKQS
jgi:hypothetical protein